MSWRRNRKPSGGPTGGQRAAGHSTQREVGTAHDWGDGRRSQSRPLWQEEEDAFANGLPRGHGFHFQQQQQWGGPPGHGHGQGGGGFGGGFEDGRYGQAVAGGGRGGYGAGFQFGFSGGAQFAPPEQMARAPRPREIRLDPMKSHYREDVARLTGDRRVMDSVGGGVWTGPKLDNFLRDCDADARLLDQRSRAYFYWAVLADGAFAGLVGVHVVRYRTGLDKGAFFLTIMVDPRFQGLGVGTAAVSKAVTEFFVHRDDVRVVYADVHHGNVGSEAVMKKAGFRVISDRVMINRTAARRFQRESDTEAVVIRTPGEQPAARESSALAKSSLNMGPPTFSFVAEFEFSIPDILEKNVLHAHQPAWHRVRVDDALGSTVDLVFVDGKFMWDRRFYDIKSRLKSRLEAPRIANKVTLHAWLMQVMPAAIMETYVVDDRTTIADNEVWIWRPERGWKAQGIHVLRSPADLVRVRHDFKRVAQQQAQRQRRGRKASEPERAIISRYILDPLLDDKGRKMHLRMYFVVVIEPGNHVRAYLARDGEMFVAKTAYSRTDLNNKDAQDTHGTTSDDDYRFPRDCPRPAWADSVFEQMREILACVAREAGASCRCYDESVVGFEIFGVDFMVLDEGDHGTVKLIEINSKPGLDPHHMDNRKWLSQLIFEIAYDTAIGPIFQDGFRPTLDRVVELYDSSPALATGDTGTAPVAVDASIDPSAPSQVEGDRVGQTQSGKRDAPEPEPGNKALEERSAVDEDHSEEPEPKRARLG